MALTATDWTVATNGDIRYIGDDHGGTLPSYATVLELHRWLQDLADDAAASGDDLISIVSSTPSERSTDNFITLQGSYNIDAAAAQHIYDGSVVQAAGATIYDGVVNFGNAVWIEVNQNGALITDDFWNEGGGTFNGDATAGISHRFIVLVRTGGSDINGRRLIGQTREFGKTYAEFAINGSARGNNVLALSDADDLNNQTTIGTIAAMTGIVNSHEGYYGIDIDGVGGNEYYYSYWDFGAQSVNDFYERLKWLQRRGTASTLYGLSADLFRGITHEIVIDTPTGTFVEPEAVSWATGTGQLLAIDSVTAGTKMWIQLLTGVAPVNDQTITGAGAATCAVNVTVTERTLSFPFVGQSTGSALIGSYGLGVHEDDLTARDKLFDLTNAQLIPPNNVVFTLSGLVSGDRVLVGPSSGGNLDTAQLALNTTLVGATETAIVCTAAIPADTPAAGTLRIQLDSGIWRLVSYTSYASATFAIASTDFSGANTATATADIFVSYIDKATSTTQESYTTVYATDRTLFIRVRNGGGSPIKTFESVATLGSSGGSASTTRTADV